MKKKKKNTYINVMLENSIYVLYMFSSVPAEKKAAVVEAVTALPCFAEAGSGIIFCNEAQDFTVLGKK